MSESSQSNAGNSATAAPHLQATAPAETANFSISPFAPPIGMRSAHTQSMLASMKIRAPWTSRRAREVLAASQHVLIRGDDGVTLDGYYAAHPGNGPLAILIHGWEGSAQSQYILSCAGQLFSHGYSVFRLQLRDHGDNHHLNRELFHSCRLAETAEAVKQVCNRFANGQVFLGGFSLGGNFALRISLLAASIELPLSGTCAVSPVIDPAPTLRTMEQGPAIYHYYFMRKWRRSLTRKLQFFPDAIDPKVLDTHRKLVELTSVLVETIGGFDSVQDYFDGYSIRDERLAGIAIPSSILAAKDDPIVPDEPLRAVDETGHLKIHRTDHGGHCGFINNLHDPSYADRFMLSWFNHLKT